MTLTNEDLKSIKNVVSEELNSRFFPLEEKIDSIDMRVGNIEYGLGEIRKDLDGLREQKKEVDQIKEFLTEKFGIKIAVQR